MNPLLRSTIPVLFVLLWSTGFISARIGMDTAEPASFLTIRFFLAAVLLFAIAWLFPSLKTQALNDKKIAHAAVAGILLQAIYLGGVFAGVNQGIGAGLSSLIVGIQPVLTVLLASVWLSEKLTLSKIVGIALGFLGVALVTSEWRHVDNAISLTGIGFCVSALLGITLGTLYQKKFCQSMDLHINMISQYVASTLFLLPIALVGESFSINWTVNLVLVMAWLIIVLSIGAVFLLMWLLSAGEAGRVSTLFFLVPPVVAIEAWILFNEPLTATIIIGTAISITGVAIVVKAHQSAHQLNK